MLESSTLRKQFTHGILNYCISDSEPETVEKQEDHTHHKLPPLTKLNQPTSPWQRESSPWLQESPLWQQSFSPWQNDREQSNSKSYSRSGSNQQNGVSNNVKITKSRASRTNAVVSLGGRTVHSEKQRNFTAPNSLFTSTSNSSNTNGYSAVQPSRKLSISTPVLDSRVEVKPPSRGQMQGSRTAPGRNRDQKSNKTYLFCPQRQASTDLQFETDFYMSSLEDEIGREETVDLLPMGGIENYKHFALRNPNHRAEIDLQRVYDRTYRPSLKLPKCNGTIVTTINPQFINNNCSSRQHAILRKVRTSLFFDREFVAKFNIVFVILFLTRVKDRIIYPLSFTRVNKRITKTLLNLASDATHKQLSDHSVKTICCSPDVKCNHK